MGPFLSFCHAVLSRLRGRGWSEEEEGGEGERKIWYQLYLTMTGTTMTARTKKGELTGSREQQTHNNREVEGCCAAGQQASLSGLEQKD